MKLLFLAFLCVLTFQIANAQGLAIQVGYNKIASNNLFLGIDYRISDHNKENSFNVGIGSYFGKFENTNSVTPELHVNYTYRNLYLYELSTTNKGLNPNIGFNLLNFIKLKAGYNASYNANNYSGFTFGINVSLGKSGYYDNLKYM